jgi:hypothetical protein
LLLQLILSCQTVPKTKQISDSIGEEVLWRENFPIIRGNDAFFLRITGKFPLQGNSSPILSEICLDFGTVYIKQLMENTSIHVPLYPPDTIPLTLCMEAGVKEKAKQLRIQNYSKIQKWNIQYNSLLLL